MLLKCLLLAFSDDAGNGAQLSLGESGYTRCGHTMMYAKAPCYVRGSK